jgi:hypothetical protein
VINSSGYSISAVYVGDNTAPTSCGQNYPTVLYAMNTFLTTYNAPAMMWHSIPANNFNTIDIMKFSGGGGPIQGHNVFNLCGITTGSYPITFVPAGGTATVDVVVYPGFYQVTVNP